MTQYNSYFQIATRIAILVGFLALSPISEAQVVFVSGANFAQKDAIGQKGDAGQKKDAPNQQPALHKKQPLNLGKQWNTEIYIMDADGRNPRNLTNHQAWENAPSGSPDGQKIAFVSNRESWFPDGQKIAFVSNRDGNVEIYVMNADGSHPRNLTNHPAWDEHPSWSPDGQQIAFVSNRDGNVEIYVMDADGWERRNLRHGCRWQSSTQSDKPSCVGRASELVT
jgi:TolB protein